MQPPPQQHRAALMALTCWALKRAISVALLVAHTALCSGFLPARQNSTPAAALPGSAPDGAPGGHPSAPELGLPQENIIKTNAQKSVIRRLEKVTSKKKKTSPGLRSCPPKEVREKGKGKTLMCSLLPPSNCIWRITFAVQVLQPSSL